MRKSDIVRRSGAGGTSAYIRGTRVRVSDIASLVLILRDETMEERINRALPHLTPEQIDAALAYWNSHSDEIEAQIEEEEALFREIAAPV